MLGEYAKNILLLKITEHMHVVVLLLFEPLIFLQYFSFLSADTPMWWVHLKSLQNFLLNHHHHLSKILFRLDC
jgi:hypothetical protein